MASIGTHSGAFQADEALGVYMLRQLPQYQQAALVRSRDPEVPRFSIGPLSDSPFQILTQYYYY